MEWYHRPVGGYGPGRDAPVVLGDPAKLAAEAAALVTRSDAPAAGPDESSSSSSPPPADNRTSRRPTRWPASLS